jgi:predicted enzyme related to lactoylglutathione lyase
LSAFFLFGIGNPLLVLTSCRTGSSGTLRASKPATDEEEIMRVTGITANLSVADIATASEFYREYLGLSVEAMNLGWVARYASGDGRASLQLVSGDASAPHDSVISVHVGDDVDEAYAEARRRGYEIVHPLTEEPWGVRRFFVRAPDGNIINIVSHSDE